jgi:hypothetical protein
MAELKEMKRVGMRVPPQAFDLLVEADLAEYEDMKASEIAELLIELA